MTKLTWDQVREIRKVYASTRTRAVIHELAKRHGVRYSTILKIVKGSMWSDPTYEPNFNYNYSGPETPKAKFTWDQVNEIRRVYIPRDPEFGIVAMARTYGVCRTTIYNIVHGYTYKED